MGAAINPGGDEESFYSAVLDAFKREGKFPPFFITLVRENQR